MISLLVSSSLYSFPSIQDPSSKIHARETKTRRKGKQGVPANHDWAEAANNPRKMCLVQHGYIVIQYHRSVVDKKNTLRYFLRNLLSVKSRDSLDGWASAKERTFTVEESFLPRPPFVLRWPCRFGGPHRSGFKLPTKRINPPTQIPNQPSKTNFRTTFSLVVVLIDYCTFLSLSPLHNFIILHRASTTTSSARDIWG